ncbi:Unknown protein sequence [Pseudomonas coronafaciens pv. oryzae]|nr:Unknown protein sequence [Pseudomonas coronafaciens pv. oryzae]
MIKTRSHKKGRCMDTQRPNKTQDQGSLQIHVYFNVRRVTACMP